MSKILSVSRHSLEILCMHKILGVHDVPYAKLMPNVHQRMDKISRTSAYVGAIRCGVSTPLHTFGISFA